MKEEEVRGPIELTEEKQEELSENEDNEEGWLRKHLWQHNI